MASNEIIKAEQVTVIEAAKHFMDSGLFPNCRNESEAFVKIQAGAEMGIGPFQAMSRIHIWEQRGQTCQQTGYQLVGAAIKKSGRYNYRVKQHTTQGCWLVFLERIDGQWEVAGDSVFTEDDAKRQGLSGKDNWRRMPKTMMFARALTQGANMYCPDVFGGAVYAEGDDFGESPAPPNGPAKPQTLADKLGQRELPKPADDGGARDPSGEYRGPVLTNVGEMLRKEADVANAVKALQATLKATRSANGIPLYNDRQAILFDLCEKLGCLKDGKVPISFSPMTSRLSVEQLDQITDLVRDMGEPVSAASENGNDDNGMLEE